MKHRYASLAAALVFAVASDAAAQTLTFARDDYPSSAGARAVVSADFNRDGWPDIAHANTGRNTVSILVNRGGNGFTRVGEVPVGAGPFALATADFNRDGIPDLAVANADGNSITILIGKGDCTFMRADVRADAQDPRGIAAVDINEDGRPDLVYTGYATGTVQALFGDGAGGFTNGIAYKSAALNPQGLATGDFNHDGHIDIAVAYATTTGLRILYGDGGTAFSARTFGGGVPLNVVSVGDFDGDGWSDIAAASTANSVVVVFKGSAAGMTRTNNYVVGSSPRGIAVADLNADGRPDVVTANRASSTVSILTGDAAHAGLFLPHVDVAAAPGSRAAAVADFDGDGRLDIASGNEMAPVATVLLNRTFFEPAAFSFRRMSGDGIVLAGDGVVLASDEPFAASHGDMNRDGILDRVSAEFDPTADQYALRVRLGRRDGTFAAPSTSVPLPTFSKAVVGDINRDGRLDVVVLSSLSSGSGEAHVWLGDGAGGLAASPATATFSTGFDLDFGLADVNRDGFLDVVVAERQQVAVALGGPAGFSPPLRTPAQEDENARSLTIGDLNLDGRLDVAFGPGDIMLGNGDGTFTSAGRFDFRSVSLIADVTGDGLPDIVGEDLTGAPVVLANTRGTVNHAPMLEPLPDRTIPYSLTQDCDAFAEVAASDPDAHWLTYAWKLDDGPWTEGGASISFCGLPLGSHVYTQRVTDGRGGVATESFTMTVSHAPEIVLWAADNDESVGWERVADSTAAGGVRLHDPNLGAPKMTAPKPSDVPANRLTLHFYADPTLAYKLWIRLKADANSWANDSVWVQFSGATTVSGSPVAVIGSTSGLSVNLEECSGCGESGWGWEDDGWGAANVNGIRLRFPQNPNFDLQEMTIQTREDGVSIDQIVLSADRYLTARPGAAKNDQTILPETLP